MSTIKTFVKYLADRFLTKEDLLPGLLEQQDVAERATSATSFFKKSAALLDQNSKSYKACISAAEDLLITHHRASSFSHLCRRFVRLNSHANYYTVALIGQVIEAHHAESGVTPDKTGGEAGMLLTTIADDLNTAKAIKNPISRNSVVRTAIKTALPGIRSDRLALLVELVQNA